MRETDIKKVVMLLPNDFLYPFIDIRVAKEATSLKEAGYDVTVVTWAIRVDPKKYPKEFTYQGVKIVRQ
jgi:hypothetical protein